MKFETVTPDWERIGRSIPRRAALAHPTTMRLLRMCQSLVDQFDDVYRDPADREVLESAKVMIADLQLMEDGR